MITANRLLEMAVAQSWQLALLIVLIAMVVRLTARNRPHLAHVLWLVVLAKCLMPPVLSSPSGVFCWLQPVNREANSDPVAPLAPADVGPYGAARPAMEPESRRGAATAPPWEVNVAIEGRKLEKGANFVGRSDKSDPGRLQTRSSRMRWLIAIWLTGAAGVLLVTTLRFVIFVRRLGRASVRRDHALQACVQRLSKQIGVRGSIRLLVTESRVGPAVIGLFRPLIVLPSVIVDGRSTAELEPILAHELIHIRRGDLWLGLLQVIARALWWFHPLVWLATRLASREAERCCDEEVIGELRCDPSRYARSLLDVLERKQALRPVPAFPGVRAVDITSTRLERIMKLGQGCRRRTPWWCWLVMLLIAMVTLPGAAIVAGVKDKAKKKQDRLAAKRLARIQAEDIEGSRRSTPDQRVVSVYKVDDLLTQIRREFDLDQDKAQEMLILYLKRIVGGPWRGDVIAGDGVESDSRLQGSVVLDEQRHIAAADKRLLVQLDQKGHQAVRAALEAMREHGFRPIEIKLRFIEGPIDEIAKLHSDWSATETAIAEADRPEGIQVKNPEALVESFARSALESEAAILSRATTVVEKNVPMVFAMVDDDIAARVVAKSQAHRHLNVLQAPKVNVLNGQTVTIQDTTKRPFVVGVKAVTGTDSTAYQPQVRVIREGISVRLRPVLQAEKRLRLDCELTLSDIRSVATAEIPQGDAVKPATIQIPEVARTKLDTAVKLKLDQTLLIGGLRTDSPDGSPEGILVMLTTREVKSRSNSEQRRPRQATSREAEVTTFSRVYNVADLVVPPPGTVTSEQSGKSPAITFEPLKKLIRTTVAPDTWTGSGGSGAIEDFPTNLSLVVSQTQDVHEQISDLLRRLRRLQDVQVTLDLKPVTIPAAAAKSKLLDKWISQSPATLSAADTEVLLEALSLIRGGARPGAPKVTLFSGQGVDLALPFGSARSYKVPLKLAAQIAGDRRSVRVSLAVDAANAFEVMIRGEQFEIPEGQTLLLDVTEPVLAASHKTGIPLLDRTPGGRSFLPQIEPDSVSEKMLLLLTPIR